MPPPRAQLVLLTAEPSLHSLSSLTNKYFLEEHVCFWSGPPILNFCLVEIFWTTQHSSGPCSDLSSHSPPGLGRRGNGDWGQHTSGVQSQVQYIQQEPLAWIVSLCPPLPPMGERERETDFVHVSHAGVNTWGHVTLAQPSCS